MQIVLRNLNAITFVFFGDNYAIAVFFGFVVTRELFLLPHFHCQQMPTTVSLFVLISDNCAIAVFLAISWLMFSSASVVFAVHLRLFVSLHFSSDKFALDRESAVF